MNHTDRPWATYRLQFNANFRFDDARALVPYFSRLGVTHLYSSPLLRARADSTHGYDVVDPRTINPNMGDETAFRNLVGSLQAHGLGLVLDIVPNHMAAAGENPYWEHVLTYGASSPYARWFDIDWRMPHPEMWGRVLVPILGEPMPRVLAQDQIGVFWGTGRFRIRYWDHTYPLDPATVPAVCQVGMDDLREALPPGHPALAEIESILAELDALPERTIRARRKVELPIETAEELLSQLAQTIEMSPQIHAWAVSTAERFGEGSEGQTRMRQLLRAQNYRLVYWRRAARILNYRRFFDINDLISVRQEDPEVFDETHALVARWTAEGLLDGLRIDHIDGLRDPLGYLGRLRDMVREQDPADRELPIWVEKILAHDEPLPAGWPVAGTTGYEFLNELEAIFLSPDGYATIEHNYRRLLGRSVQFEQVAAWGKRRVLKADLSAFVGRLADILFRLAQQRPETSALKMQELVGAVVEFVVALPCYRTYVDGRGNELSQHDCWAIESALAKARDSHRASNEGLNFLEHVLLGSQEDLSEHDQHERLNFVIRLQQLTGPATAKGVEDTALYAYVPLVSRNEVGGEPHTDLTHAVDRLHSANHFRSENLPRAMLCATTHDTKRSADVRARLDVLSECPQEWDALVRKWRQWNRSRRRRVMEKSAPDPATEYLFYQTLVGVWPVSAEASDAETRNSLTERLQQYMLKAIREAKIHTSWTTGDADYEDAVTNFIREALAGDDDNSRAFLDDVQKLVGRIARPGFWNSLARTLVQFTAPGTPDLYQGDELWNFTLVDPDNRREVDYTLRQQMLDDLILQFDSTDEARAKLLTDLVQSPEDGRIKLHVVRGALHTRRELPMVFARGSYEAVAFEGARSEHLFGYLRAEENAAAIVIVPRLATGIDDWQDARALVPESWRGREWRSVFTREQFPASGDALPIADVLAQFPVALLVTSE